MYSSLYIVDWVYSSLYNVDWVYSSLYNVDWVYSSLYIVHLVTLMDQHCALAKSALWPVQDQLSTGPLHTQDGGPVDQWAFRSVEINEPVDQWYCTSLDLLFSGSVD